MSRAKSRLDPFSRCLKRFCFGGVTFPFSGAPLAACPLQRVGVSVYCRNEPSQVTTSSIAALGTAKWSAGTVTNLLLGCGGALSKM